MYGKAQSSFQKEIEQDRSYDMNDYVYHMIADDIVFVKIVVQSKTQVGYRPIRHRTFERCACEFFECEVR